MSASPAVNAWTKVVFGDLVENINEYFDRDEGRVSRYLAGEHIDERDLAVRRWGMTDDGVFPPTFKRMFKAGDVLFHSRNPDKLVQPNFDGVTGEKLFVLRSRDPSVLLQELVPYLLLTDHFADYVRRTRSGSVNKFLNWTPLANYEFSLPPLDEQQRFVKALLAAEESIRAHRMALEALNSVASSLSDLLFSADESKKNGWLSVSVGPVCERVTVGIVVTPAKYYSDTGIRCFRSANVRRGEVQDSDWVFLSNEAHAMHSKSVLRTGDVMVVRSGANAGMCCVVPAEYDGSNCVDIVFATPKADVLASGWLELFINSAPGRRQILRGERGLAQKHFGVTAMKHLELPLPTMGEQVRFVELASTLRERANQVSARIEHLGTLQRAISTASLSSAAFDDEAGVV